MKDLLDDFDPLFMGAAVMIACLSAIAHLPEPPLLLDHPPLTLPAAEDD